MRAYLLLSLLVVAPTCADDGSPLIVTPEEIRAHVKAQEAVIQIKNERIDELTKLLRDAQKQIEGLHGKSNCT